VAVQTISAPPMASQGFHIAFVVAWFFCLLFYFTQYAIRNTQYAIRNPFRAGRDDSRTDGGIRLVGSGRKFAAWYLLLHLFDIRDYRRRLARPVEREMHHSNWRQVFERGGSTGIAAIAAAIILAFFIRETGAAVRPPALSKPV
jgi:hypothetical protein